MKKVLLLIILLSFTLLSAKSNDDDKDKISKEEKKKLRQEKKAQKVKEGKLLVTPYIAPGYTPEMGGVIAAGGLFSFKTNPKDSLIQRSSIPINFTYMSTGGILVNAIVTTFWLQDKLRFNADLWYKNMPDNYWGIGYQNGKNRVKSDSTTAYHREWFWINPHIIWQPVNDFFVGYELNYTYTHGTDACDTVQNDPNYKEFNDKPLNSGMGVNLKYDTRDFPTDARNGLVFDFRGMFYTPSFGGDNKFQEYSLDYRQFSNFRKGSVLAWQAKARLTMGDVPYGEMSQLGTPFDLRGYIWGQYRNNHMFFTIMEYRHTFLKEGELSRHGLVTWFGTGSVFDNEELSDNNLHFLPNFGIGYRFEIQPRMFLRLDIGVGQESSGLYFNFNQAF